MSVVHSHKTARAPVAVSLVLSLAVHAGMVGAVATVFAVRSVMARVAPWLAEPPEERVEAPPEPPAAAPPEAQPKPPEDDENVVWVRPGIDDSTSDADTWIGYKEATEHVASPSSIDQSPMTEELPGMNGEAETMDRAASAPTPGLPLPMAPETTESVATEAPPVETLAPPTEATATPESAPAPSPPAPKTPAPVPEEEAPEVIKPPAKPAAPPPQIVIAPEADPKDEPEREAPKVEEPDGESDAKEPKEASPAPPPAKEEPAPKAPEPAAPPPGTRRPGSAQSPVPAGVQAEKADKEADATSIKEAVDYRYGRVKAGDGIDIKTVKPDFSALTRLTAIPRPPIVEISFTTKGKVKNVRLLQSSGYKDVDEPIINAVWAWRAKGKKLDALAKQNPDALLKISIRMLL